MTRLVLLSCAVVLVACGRDHDARVMSKRIGELQDSLRIYRDSLHDVQESWSFNALMPVVQMDNYEISLGDSCRVRVFIAGMNTTKDHPYFRYQRPQLSADVGHGLKGGVTIVEHDGWWSLAFKPTSIGQDSLSGTIVFPNSLGTSSEPHSFKSGFEVHPR